MAGQEDYENLILGRPVFHYFIFAGLLFLLMELGFNFHEEAGNMNPLLANCADGAGPDFAGAVGNFDGDSAGERSHVLAYVKVGSRLGRLENPMLTAVSSVGNRCWFCWCCCNRPGLEQIPPPSQQG